MPIHKTKHLHLYYETQGKGDPLLFISGFSSRHQGWLPFVNRFSPMRQTVVFDNWGSGQSSTPSLPLTLDMFTHDVIALLDHLSLAKVDLIGSSMGSAIALNLALNYPDRIGKGVLISPFAKLPQTSLLKSKAIGKLLESRAAFDLVIEVVLPWLFSSEFLSNPNLRKEQTARLLDNPHPQSLEGYLGQLRALEAFDIRKHLKEISTPFLLIAGEEDLSTLLISCAKPLAKELPQSELHILPAAGHMVHVEKRSLVIDLILSFLSLL